MPIRFLTSKPKKCTDRHDSNSTELKTSIIIDIPNAVYVSAIFIVVKPVTLTALTAVNKLSMNQLLHLVYKHPENLIVKRKMQLLKNNKTQLFVQG